MEGCGKFPSIQRTFSWAFLFSPAVQQIGSRLHVSVSVNRAVRTGYLTFGAFPLDSSRHKTRRFLGRAPSARQENQGGNVKIIRVQWTKPARLSRAGYKNAKFNSPNALLRDLRCNRLVGKLTALMNCVLIKKRRRVGSASGWCVFHPCNYLEERLYLFTTIARRVW